ncbi:hypothetical protein [Xenorhabdus hominickii]|uniref:Uncharacterized protein n=1 Tax=Xenorhabdus hominickii TaxID=351679 RepID=A0A2G0Q248_XENHO|nr:hypothetical protein [Xenorhabdus hominickii]AOM40208.1 hypothetical protein A9255_06215 [Xenorhabdus hominickii]PHM53289.1 hypothetical protein Xhom_04184 [Xenorhabdus hominickii]
MSEKLENPVLNPIDAAYQVVMELVKAGTFSHPSSSASYRAESIVTVFDALKERFEKLKSEINS